MDMCERLRDMYAKCMCERLRDMYAKCTYAVQTYMQLHVYGVTHVFAITSQDHMERVCNIRTSWICFRVAFFSQIWTLVIDEC